MTFHEEDFKDGGEARRRDRELAAVAERIARWELRERAGRYLHALTAVWRRGNGRPLAAAAGEPTPTNVQRFSGRARRNAHSVRGDLRGYVVDRLAVPGEAGRSVLIAGVAR
ncbi:hypothetical protein [Alienimonas sp. DA493]|uniref:hypothetical protein n=1 Tax=Alienimonas sp. DA493 TaxID=3373605 RepID=UPI00375495E8